MMAFWNAFHVLEALPRVFKLAHHYLPDLVKYMATWCNLEASWNSSPPKATSNCRMKARILYVSPYGPSYILDTTL